VSGAGFRPFRVTGLVRESARVVSVHLAPGDGLAGPRWLPGQSVRVRLPDGDGGVERSYSISAPADRGLRISVTPEGRAGALLHAVAVGASLEVSAPGGGFGFDPAGREPVALISAGCGVGPLLACLLAQAAHRPERRLVWVHVARSPAEHAFAAEADRALARMPRAVRHVRYTCAGAGPVEELPAGGARGRLTPAALADAGVDASFSAYLCGPPGFVEGVRGMLAGLGLPAAAVHLESSSGFSGVARPVSAASAVAAGHDAGCRRRPSPR
jgi:ferredoxin-NADP reductase